MLHQRIRGPVFYPPHVALATALNFQMSQNSLNMMWNVRLFRMRPITAILVHWFKRYRFLVAPVSDRNTVQWCDAESVGYSANNYGPLVL